jgi:hypothetical protein
MKDELERNEGSVVWFEVMSWNLPETNEGTSASMLSISVQQIHTWHLPIHNCYA